MFFIKVPNGLVYDFQGVNDDGETVWYTKGKGLAVRFSFSALDGVELFEAKSWHALEEATPVTSEQLRGTCTPDISGSSSPSPTEP